MNFIAKLVKPIGDDLCEPQARHALKQVWQSPSFWVLMGVITGWVYCLYSPVFGQTPSHTLVPAVGLWLFTTLLLAITVADFKTMIIPDVLVYPLAILAFGFAPHALPYMLWVAGVLAGGFWLIKATTEKIKQTDTLGWGDIKLVAALGLWVGFEGVVPLLLVSSGTALLAVFVRFITKVDPKTLMPFAPYLAFGGWVAYGYATAINTALINLRFYLLELI